MSDYFPQELIEPILLKLPVPSLVKFTVVCKEWNSLITSHGFVSSRVSHALSIPYNSRPTLFVYSTLLHSFQHCSLHFDPKSFADQQSISVPLPFPSTLEKDFGHYIVGITHGLICFKYEEKLSIWNPLIRRYIELPRPKISCGCIFLHVDTGFVFDPVKNDYKVVRIVPQLLGMNIKLRAELYSLKERLWREISQDKVRVKRHYAIYNESHCSVNNAIHWMESEEANNSILVFNICSESFSNWALPEELVSVKEAWDLHVHEINGLLTIVHYQREQERDSPLHYCCTIWAMKEYGVSQSWTKIYKVDALFQLRVASRTRGDGDLLMLKSDGQELESEIVSYDPVNKSIKSTGIQALFWQVCAEAYTESLLLIDKESGAISY